MCCWDDCVESLSAQTLLMAVVQVRAPYLCVRAAHSLHLSPAVWGGKPFQPTKTADYQHAARLMTAPPLPACLIGVAGVEQGEISSAVQHLCR